MRMLSLGPLEISPFVSEEFAELVFGLKRYCLSQFNELGTNFKKYFSGLNSSVASAILYRNK